MMRTFLKIILWPIWILLTVIVVASKIAITIASTFLYFLGGLVLVLVLIALILGAASGEQALHVSIIGIAALALPFLSSLLLGVLMAGQELLGDYIRS